MVETCEECGSLSALTVDRCFPRLELPDEYSHLCRDCAEEANTHTAEDMTDAELIAGIVDDSIGYASPGHAAQHVEAWRDGEDYAWCERAVSCFGFDESEIPEDDRGSFTGMTPGDLDQLIERARATWCAMDDDKRARLLEVVEEWAEIEEEGDINSIGLMYPTMGV